LRLNWFLLWFAYSSLFAFGFIDNARGPVFPDILKDFALSDSIGALFFLVASGAALINNLLLFKWLERIGSYRTTQVYSVAQVIGLLIIGLGPVFPITLIGAAFVGVSFGGLGISHNLLVTESVPADGGTGGQLGLRRRALSGLHATYGVSSLLAPLTITWLYKLGFNWRMSLAWLAVGPTLVLLLSLFGKPSGITLLTKAQQSQPRGKRALKVAMFFAVMSTGYVIAEISIGTRLALFARREWGFSLETANDLVS
jgi:FHS family glucose/mannose:H+ symporter-like MFS transporter